MVSRQDTLGQSWLLLSGRIFGTLSNILTLGIYFIGLAVDDCWRPRRGCDCNLLNQPMYADVLGWQQTLQLLLQPLQHLAGTFDWRIAEAALYCIRYPLFLSCLC